MTIVINGTTGISGVDGSAGTPAVQGTDTNTGVFYPAADTVGVSTGGSERVRVDSSGNVGIGTTNTTDQRLKVKQSADTGASSFSFKVEANANDTGLYIGYRGAGAATAADTCAITATYGSTGAFKPMTFLTSDAERMRIDSSGNVGIGTSAPRASKLDVLSATGTQNTSADNPGLVNITGPNGPNGSQPILVLATNDAMAANIGPAITFQARYVTSSTAAATFAYIQGIKENATSGNLQGALLFVTRNSAGNFPEAMRIDSSGNVGIGLTPSYRLSVLDSAAGARVVDIQNTASTGNPIMQYSTMTVTGTTSNYFFVGRANASDRVYIYGSGNIVNVNNSYGALSDVKLKENITDATPKLSDLMRVKVRNYNLIGETQKQIGVVAQELEQVFPSMVDETIDRDTEGNELETTTKSVKYSVFVPMLIKAIQEQQALITALTARIEALENK